LQPDDAAPDHDNVGVEHRILFPEAQLHLPASLSRGALVVACLTVLNINTAVRTYAKA
jgi:hypothetical protein